MHATKTRVALGTLTVFTLLLGVAVYVPIASADTPVPEAERSIASEIGTLRNASVDRDDDGHPELRELNIVSRATSDTNEDGVPDVTVDVAYRAAAYDDDSDGALN